MWACLGSRQWSVFPLFALAPGKLRAEPQSVHLVVPWRSTLTSALASLHSHSIGGHLVPTALRFFGDMAGLEVQGRRLDLLLLGLHRARSATPAQGCVQQPRGGVAPGRGFDQEGHLVLLVTVGDLFCGLDSRAAPREPWRNAGRLSPGSAARFPCRLWGRASGVPVR